MKYFLDPQGESFLKDRTIFDLGDIDSKNKKKIRFDPDKYSFDVHYDPYYGICHEEGGGLEGVSSAIYLFWKMIFVKNHLESFPDCKNVFCT